jgi:hypothetical protein
MVLIVSFFVVVLVALAFIGRDDVCSDAGGTSSVGMHAAQPSSADQEGAETPRPATEDNVGTGIASFFAAADGELIIGTSSKPIFQRIRTATDDETHAVSLPAGKYWVAFNGKCPKIPGIDAECVLDSFPEEFTVVANRKTQIVISHLRQGYALRTPSAVDVRCGKGPNARACGEGELCAAVRQDDERCLKDCTDTGECPEGEKCTGVSGTLLSGSRLCLAPES